MTNLEMKALLGVSMEAVVVCGVSLTDPEYDHVQGAVFFQQEQSV